MLSCTWSQHFRKRRGTSSWHPFLETCRSRGCTTRPTAHRPSHRTVLQGTVPAPRARVRRERRPLSNLHDVSMCRKQVPRRVPWEHLFVEHSIAYSMPIAVQPTSSGQRARPVAGLSPGPLDIHSSGNVFCKQPRRKSEQQPRANLSASCRECCCQRQCTISPRSYSECQDRRQHALHSSQ